MKRSLTGLAFISFMILTLSACTETDQVSPTGDDRDLFTGSWNCSENSKVYGSSSYNVTINKLGEADSVVFKNFYQLGSSTSTIGLVAGNGVTLPFQTVTGMEITGTGILSNNKINLTYYVVDGSIKDTVTAVYSK